MLFQPIVPQLSPTRILVIRGEQLAPGEMGVPVELEFSGGAGWLVNLHVSLRAEPDRTSEDEFLSSMGFRLWINDEDELIGSGTGNSWMMFDDVAPYSNGHLQLRRRIEPTDSIYAVFKSFSTNDDVDYLYPLLAMGFQRDRDIAKDGRRWKR